jgi:hypothetical protein
MDPKKIVRNNAFIFSAILIVLAIVGHLLNITEGPYQYLGYVIFLAGVIITCNQYAKAKENYVTFGELFTAGFRMTAIITLAMIAFMAIFYFAMPDFTEKALEISRAKIEEQNSNMSEEQIEQAMAMTKKFMLPFMIGAILFSYLLMGVIFSLIGAGVTKKKNPAEKMMQDMNQKTL